MKFRSLEESKKIPAQEVARLWQQYKATGDKRVRNRLVMSFTPLVRYIVFKKVRELPARCEVDDFISCGLEALIQAIERFDPVRGTTLEQFAWTRIHGAVIDELRRQDWAPRSLRRWERDIGRARDSFTAAHGRHPSNEELAQVMGVDRAEIHRRERDIDAADVSSLNAIVTSDEESAIEKIDTVAGEGRGLDPEETATGQQAKSRFREAFSQLGERERKVAIMLYANEATLREIGEEIGVSESRVCQIHAQLKRTLRKNLSPEDELFASAA